jgi:hypothetical protein
MIGPPSCVPGSIPCCLKGHGVNKFPFFIPLSVIFPSYWITASNIQAYCYPKENLLLDLFPSHCCLISLLHFALKLHGLGLAVWLKCREPAWKGEALISNSITVIKLKKKKNQKTSRSWKVFLSFFLALACPPSIGHLSSR